MNRRERSCAAYLKVLITEFASKPLVPSHNKSRTLFRRAQQLLPGGVDSPVRAFKSVGGEPLFIRRGSGATLVDVDGNGFAGAGK